MSLHTISPDVKNKQHRLYTVFLLMLNTSSTVYLSKGPGLEILHTDGAHSEHFKTTLKSEA